VLTPISILAISFPLLIVDSNPLKTLKSWNQ
jgi:hypothetical protein